MSRVSLLVLLLSVSLCARAQNSDLALLIGATATDGKVVSANGTTVTTGSAAVAVQVNYAWQLVQKRVDLYVEVPLELVGRGQGTVVVAPGAVSVGSSTSPDVYLTPGLRVKFSPQSRVSFLGSAGFGLATFGPRLTVTGTRVSSGPRHTVPAFAMSAGTDVRLTKLLSLRVEVRDFVTETGLGDSSGHHHPMVQGGVAFHF